ncbi:MAG: EAL domain-containing protein [Marinomonas sp.]
MYKLLFLLLFVFYGQIKAQVQTYPEFDGNYANQDLLTAKEVEYQKSLRELNQNTQLSGRQALQQLSFSTDLYTESQGYSDIAFWHLIPLPKASRTNQTIHLKFANVMIDELNFYLIRDGRQIKAWQRGAQQEWLPGNDKNAIWLAIPLSDQVESSLLIRKRSNSSLLSPIAFYQDKGVETAKLEQKVTWTVLTSALILLLFYNIAVYSFFRAPAFIYYILLNCSLILGISVTNGMGIWLFPDSVFSFLHQFKATINAISLWSVYRFSLLFFNTKNSFPLLWKKRFIGDTVLISYICASLVFSYQELITSFLSLQLIVSFMCIFGLVHTGSQKSWAIKSYLVAWSCVIFGASVETLIFLNVIPYTQFSSNVYPVCTIIELIGFSLAFAEKAHSNEINRKHQLITDLHTGLPNRRFYFTQLETKLKKLAFTQDSFALVTIQFTSQDSMNHVFGPEKADIAIRQTALVLNLTLLQDERAITFTMPNKDMASLIKTSTNTLAFLCKDKHKLDEIIQQLQDVLDGVVTIEHFDMQHQYSIGAALYPEHTNNIDTLFRYSLIAADINNLCSDPWSLFNQKYQINHIYQHKLLARLKEDVREKRLTFEVQPQVELNSGRIIGGEVLIRWHNEEMGKIGPDEFIPLAESAGLIYMVTQMIINKVFAWVADNRHIIENKHLSINISAKDILRSDFSLQLINASICHGVPPESFILEVTESSFFEHNSTVENNIKTLKDAGFRLSIDDFGAGYSSMHSVMMLSPAEIKIDRMFIQNLHKDETSFTLCKTLVTLITELGAQTVAEGVEGQQTINQLLEWGCQVGQGFGLYKPMAPSQYSELLNKNNNLSFIHLKQEI